MTIKEARAAWRWFQSKFKLQDWCLTQLDIGSSPPEWAMDETCSPSITGRTMMFRSDKTFKVWLRPCACDDNTPLMTFFHECGHVLFEDMGMSPLAKDWYFEGGLDRIACVCEIAYLAETSRAKK